MEFGHRSKLAAAVLLFGATGCEKDPEIVSRMVTPHVSLRCAVPDEPYGVYYAAGDFQPTADAPAQAKLFLKAGAVLAGIPPQSRALVLDVSDKSGGRWLGLGGVPAEGNIDVLLWPAGEPCGLSADTGSVRGRLALAMDARHVLVAGGLAKDGSVPDAFVADLATGRVRSLTSGLLTPRVRASVTMLGDLAVVAGGVRADDPNSVLSTAEVYTPARGDFDRAPIVLSRPRADHGAVTLATGEALLVGGVGAGGVLNSLERIDPKARQAATGGMPSLAVARTRPRVVRLVSGEVLVAGGFDQANAPVGKLEFLAPDARSLRPSTGVVPMRTRSDVVALDGGGALVVIAPELADPTDFQNVWLVSADRAVTPATRIAGSLTDVRLFPGTEGRPVLWTGDRWLRWEPWTERFAVLDDAVLDPGPASEDTVAFPDPGLLSWIDGEGHVIGWRFSVRHAFVADRLPYLVSGTQLLAPDRSPSLASMAFEADRGLALPIGASVFVSDARYLDVTVDVDAPEEGLPRVVLRTDAGGIVEVGGPDCPLPFVPLPAKLHVERRGATVTFAAGTRSGTCAVGVVAGTRVAVGVRGPGRARNLRVVR